MIINTKDLLLDMFIKGVSVCGEMNTYDDVNAKERKRFKRFDFYLEDFRYSTFMESHDHTPYHYYDNKLYYDSEVVENVNVSRILGVEWGSENSWYLKKWNRNSQEPFELRLNPINVCANLRYKTGANQEFRGCAFCHRVYTHTRNSENRVIRPVDEIIDEIIAEEGRDIFTKVGKVMIMTGNMRTPSDTIKMCHSAYRRLKDEGYRGIFSISTNQFYSEDFIRELSMLDNYLFDYTLETFERRLILMGESKGYSLPVVINALSIARRYFRCIRVTYVVGLDSLTSMKIGFRYLKKHGLVDDLVPLIFVPYTPEMKMLRHCSAFNLDYYHQAQALLSELGLVPKKNGLSKNLFLENALNNKEMDSLIKNANAYVNVEKEVQYDL